MVKIRYTLMYTYPLTCSACNMHFFWATKSLSCSELIFPVSLAYYLSVYPVCSVLALNLGVVYSDWFGLHTAGGWGLEKKSCYKAI